MRVVGRRLTRRCLNRAGRRTYLTLFFLEHFLGPRLFNRLFANALARNRSRMRQYFADWPPNQVQPVREVSFLSHRDYFDNYFVESEPVVFRGAAGAWPATKKWNLDFFAEKYPTTQAIKIDQEGLYGEGEGSRFEVTTLGKLATAMAAGERLYLRFSPIIEENPELKDDLDMEWLRGFRGGFSVRELAQFFMAPADTHTPLHCALECNIFVQVSGRKRWTLYPAYFSSLLEPPADRRPYLHSAFVPGRPSPKFALAARAPALQVVLEPGDAMYIPPFVWHYVENLTPTVAVGYRYHSLRAAARSSMPLLAARLMATRPSLLHTVYYWVTRQPIFLHRPQKVSSRATQTDLA